MYSVTLNSGIVVGKADLDIDSLLPHENVVVDRAGAFKAYLESLGDDLILSSVIVCSKTHMIIDGHHRVWALKQLGYRSIPVTFVDYSSDKILPNKTAGEGVLKQTLLDAAISRKLLPPKTSCHQIVDFFGASHPIILISHICHLKTK